LFDTLTGQDIPAELADYLTFAGLLIATLIALYLWHRRRKES
jgi:LPXTG-motif cell wall-anchored protein